MRPLSRSAAAAALVLTAVATGPLHAQLPDPFVVPGGAFRIGFLASYVNWNQLFDANGDVIPLGAYLSADSVGSALLPTLAPAEAAVRSITGDAAFQLNAGAFTARLDADVRRFPFSLHLGLTNRLTFTAVVPLVTTRMNSATALDTTNADAGWNPVAQAAGNAGAVESISALLLSLGDAAASLDAAIVAGSYGCPSSVQCDQARMLVARLQALAADLAALTGVSPTGGLGAGPIPPFVPLAGSTAGQAILAAIATVSADLQSLGLTPVAGSLPLPGGRVGAGAMDSVLTDPAFGYDLSPLNPGQTTKLSGLGDIELGFRLGIAQSDAVHIVLGAAARLPTGKRADPTNLLEIGTGDRQLDLIWSLDAALEPGNRLGLWLGATYTLQLPDRLELRVAPVDAPLTPGAAPSAVDRNLGDVLWFSVYPTLRLAREMRVFLSAAYFRKRADRYTAGGTPVAALESLSTQETWSFGAGALYRATRGKSGPALPIEAWVAYRAAFYGTGGATPKTGRFDLGLRLYYNVWGQPGAPAAPRAAQP